MTLTDQSLREAGYHRWQYGADHLSALATKLEALEPGRLSFRSPMVLIHERDYGLEVTPLVSLDAATVAKLPSVQCPLAMAELAVQPEWPEHHRMIASDDLRMPKKNPATGQVEVRASLTNADVQHLREKVFDVPAVPYRGSPHIPDRLPETQQVRGRDFNALLARVEALEAKAGGAP